MRGKAYVAGEIAIEPRDEPQQGRFAATRRADDRARLSRRKRETQAFERAQRPPACRVMVLMRNGDVERRCAASG